jgi:hypothetical protein
MNSSPLAIGGFNSGVQGALTAACAVPGSMGPVRAAVTKPDDMWRK